jgi:hypothetical protein
MNHEFNYKHVALAKVSNNKSLMFETSLARILQHVENSKEKSFSIITSWRQSNPKKQNLEDFKALKTGIRNLGLGFVVVKGHWKECQEPNISYDDCPEENLVDAVEPSLVVIGADLNSISNFAFKKFNQDAIVYSGPETDGNVQLFFKDGSSKNIGSLKPQSIGQAFTELRKNRHAEAPRYFQFEGVEYTPHGYVESLIEQEVKKLLRGE